MQGQNVVRPAESVKTMHDSQGDVLLDVKGGVCYGMNLVATRIWNLLETGASMETIVDELARDFDITHEHARADVLDFMETLRARGLLQKAIVAGAEAQPKRSSLLEKIKGMLQSGLRRAG